MGKMSLELIDQAANVMRKSKKKKVWKEAQKTGLQSKTSSHTATLPLQTIYFPLYYHLDPPMKR